MYCSRFSELQGILEDDKIIELRNYFSGLIGSAKNTITVSKVSKAINISSDKSSKVLTKCKEIGILNVSYAIRCPECHMLIKKVSSLADIPGETLECYSCDEEIEITPYDIEILYSLIDDSVFLIGQQKDKDILARAVVREDTTGSIFLAGSINEYLFHPTNEEYGKLEEMYSTIDNVDETTKKIGDSLEKLVIYLFNLCSIFRAAGIRTTTNQIDCCVRNKLFLNYGVLNIIGEQFLIECKNESKTPKGDYMSKLNDIISMANAGSGNNCIKFGIIISKKEGPSTFRKLANVLFSE